MSSNNPMDKRLLLTLDGEALELRSASWGFGDNGLAIEVKAVKPRKLFEAAPPQPPAPVNCSCWNCVQARKKAKRDLIDFAKSGGPIVDGLRAREAAFNEDVLPAGATVLPPKELYGADMWPPRAVPRMHTQPPWSPDVPVRIVFKHRPNLKFKAFKKDGCYGCAHGICDECDGRRPESLNAFTAAVHQANQHWWHDPATGEKLDRNMGEMLMLVVSEIAECMEGERKDLMDDHLPHRKMAEVELADAVIRIADIAGSRRLDFDAAVAFIGRREKMHVPANKGEALHWIIKPLQAIMYYEGAAFETKMARCFVRIESYAAKHRYDLWGAVAEKREYNRHRADHKPEARLAAGGKKF